MAFGTPFLHRASKQARTFCSLSQQAREGCMIINEDSNVSAILFAHLLTIDIHFFAWSRSGKKE